MGRDRERGWIIGFFATASHPTPPDAPPGATQGALHSQAVAQILFYMVGYNTQRMLSWIKAIECLRAGLWRKKARLMWNTLNDRKLQRLFRVYWQYIQRYPLSGLEIQPFAALRPGCGSWLARGYFARLSRCMWGRLDYKLKMYIFKI